MQDRAELIANFLQQNGLQQAARQDFAADFSPRRYARLTSEKGASVILMDADANQKTHEFVRLAEILRQMDIKVPQIYAADAAHGLVLMQDFGNQNCGALVDRGGDLQLYTRPATQVLAQLHNLYDPAAMSLDVPQFDAQRFTQQVSLYVEAYVPFIKHRPAIESEKADFVQAWSDVFKSITALPQSLLLRDFMLDNLMFLPEYQDRHSIGVLDFQDAGIGPMAYDIASLGGDQVRRDLDQSVLQDVIACYCQHSRLKIPASEWLQACHIFAAQRHMRIMGLIAQLATQSKRIEKLIYLPRIEKHLNVLLQDSRLSAVRDWLKEMKMDYK